MHSTMSPKRQHHNIGPESDLYVIIETILMIFLRFFDFFEEQSNEKRPNTLNVGALVHIPNFKRIHYAIHLALRV